MSMFTGKDNSFQKMVLEAFIQEGTRALHRQENVRERADEVDDKAR